MQRGLKLAIHIALPLAAYLAAYAFVVSPPLTWWVTPDARPIWLAALLYALLAAVLEIIFRTERSSWRYVSIQDAFALVRSTFLTMAAFLVIVFVLVRAGETEWSPPPTRPCGQPCGLGRTTGRAGMAFTIGRTRPGPGLSTTPSE